MRRAPGIRRTLSTLLVVFVCLAPLHGQALPTEPMLRLETGMHTAQIRRMALDTTGRSLVTASDDKTLRLWSVDDGRLVRTLRIPIGPGNEGRLYAAALSPDGRWIATGGATQAVTEGPGNYHIYVFDAASGELRRHVAGLPSVVNHLCVSADGRHLAASLGAEGIRVFATDDWRQVAADRDYGDASHWCDFDRDGRLVASSLDGQLRLYDQRFELIARQPVATGSLPFAVAFSPDAATIAVGLADQAVVALHSGANLNPLGQPDSRGLDNGDLSKVAWSADGRRLFAGGRFQRRGTFPVVVWEQAGQGKRHFWSGTDNSLTDLRALPQGGLIAGTDDPAWLRFDTTGQLIRQRHPVAPDMRDKLGEHFRLSADGRRVVVGLGYGGERSILFDLDSRRLFEGDINETWLLQQELDEAGFDPGAIDGQMGPNTRQALSDWRRQQGLGPGGLDAAARVGLGITPLAPPLTRAAGLNVTQWKNSQHPRLNGKPLPLAPYETARALAIGPDGHAGDRGLLLGTAWYLRRFDQAGNLLWQVPTPDTVWGVNISADGRLAVAALGDGTLRWYRYADGVELLSLFVHTGTLEWVLWTPNGYYDASPGGDRLVGWHLNRAERADGLAVQHVVPGSAAEAAGLLAGDLIESIDGVAIVSKADLVAAIRQKPAGQSLRFNIVRGDDYLYLDVLPQRPDPNGPPRLGTVVGAALARANASDFYPVNSFRERFYRPQVVTGMLDTLDEGQAIAQAARRGERVQAEQTVAKSLPPLITILSPGDGERFSQAQTRVRYRVKSPGGEPVQQIQVLVDGRPLSTQRGLQRIVQPTDSTPSAGADTGASQTASSDLALGQEGVLELDLPLRDLSLTLVAENRFGASPPDTVNLRWEGGQTEGFVIQPKLYALVAGVSDYRNDALDLQFAYKDAEDFATALKAQSGGLYRDVVVRVLENPDSDGLLDGLDWLRDEVTSHDVAVLFISGHGVNDPDGNYYYLTQEADTERLSRTAVPYFHVQQTLSALPGKVLAFIDTCHSGNIMGARRSVANITPIINDLASAENGVVVFASSTGNQYSLENPEWGNGAFTKALVEGINGKADYTHDGKITINQLDLYLSERVKELTGNKQTPTTTKPQTVSDFPIAVLR
ncbi:PDZ domain-containing protein [Thiohalocapsa marina]|uniref:PDZ domain-containing protein n=1 Tax=Thiohalocapsa marina TaxID=424902 RepID=A0A5M8FI24_9GAMM|nr:caspase family protein [Thiohalocapsa marina]KAA6184094.1 PDZ domain-containing protein [Thiohalocapsa marina]